MPPGPSSFQLCYFAPAVRPPGERVRGAYRECAGGVCREAGLRSITPHPHISMRRLYCAARPLCRILKDWCLSQ